MIHRLNVLFLSCGTGACFHAIKTLKEKFPNQFRIIGADINPQYLTATGIYLDKFYQVPLTCDKDYYATIIKICENENIDVIVPSFDADQKLFFPENKELKQLKITSLGTSQETLGVYENKIEMTRFLETKGLPTPKIFTHVEEDKWYFVKPKNGVGSKGAQKMLGKDIQNLPDVTDVIIQEVCQAPEITLECFYYDKQLSTIARERIETKAGVCTKARIFNCDELGKIAQKFVEAIKTPYCFNLQFMKNSNNDYVITDVNLRLAGGMSLSYAAGWDEVSAFAKILLKKTKEEVFETLPEKVPSQYVVRAYTDIVTKVEKKVVAFDLDGTLLDSRKRHQVVMDDVLRQFDISLDTGDLVEFKRQGKNNVDYLISKGIDEKLAKEIQKKWIEDIEKSEYLKNDILYPDTLETLDMYAQTNDLILITARTNIIGVHDQLEYLGLKKYFKEIFVVQTGASAIEEKATILKEKNAILMVGDTSSDAQAAHLAGVSFKFHDDGFHSRENIGE